MLKKLLKYHVNDFLQPNRCAPILPSEGFGTRYNLILLNSKTVSKHLLEKIWHSCDLKVCADGGGNRLFDTMHEETLEYIPNIIVGDLDSLRPEVADFYSEAGCPLLRDEDEDLNDLDKCLQWIDNQTQMEERNDNDIEGASDEESLSPSSHGRPKESIVILGAQGGRFDQEMASLHALFRWKKTFDRVVLMNEECSTCLLEAGFQHRIKPVEGVEGPTCGLIPLNGKVDCVTSSGLQWDLTGESLEMGVRISSSNSIRMDGGVGGEANVGDGPTVIVESSGDLVWTCIHSMR